MEMPVVTVQRLAEAAESEERRRLLALSTAVRAAQSDEAGWKAWCRLLEE